VKVPGLRVTLRTCSTLFCTAALLLAFNAAARGATADPLYVFTPASPPPSPVPPPTGSLYGPCGLAVDSVSRVYVSDYYHHSIDVFTPGASQAALPGYVTQLAGVAPLNGPCGLAIDGGNSLYVNVFHDSVVKYGSSPSFTPGPIFDTDQSTGVAIDTASNVYVNDRTYIAVYGPTGSPVLDEGSPLRIGLGTLGEGNGIAVSRYPATEGFVYVPDASTDTVKVYNPATDVVDPVAEISTAGGQPFVSLRDSAVAVDRVSGEVYVVDNVQPLYTAKPQATVHVYSPAHSYKGHLKYNVIDALPPGLAVDNSANPSQGRVYITSGNSTPASIYAYPPGAATLAASLPPVGSGLAAPNTSGTSTAPASAAVGHETSLARSQRASSPAAAKQSAVVQLDNLRINVQGKLSPKKLPRDGVAPVAVSVGWDISTADESAPPKLKALEVEINRHGHLDYAGLPTCPYAKIQPASTKRALSNCRPSLVGRGSFTAEIALRGQEGESYETGGSLLVFKGEAKGKPVLYGQIYSARPFATSFVITFEVKEQRKGAYGTVLSATLPKPLRSWGNLTGIEMTLQRRYGHKGRRHSFLSAGCPAPEGFRLASFKLARASFSFNGGAQLSSTVTGTCQVRE
jgi:hypothetical protein